MKSTDILGFGWPDQEYISALEMEERQDDNPCTAMGYTKSDDYMVIYGSTTLSELENQLGKGCALAFLEEVLG